MDKKLFFTFLFLTLFCIKFSNSFNFVPKNAIVITNSAEGRGSYFGATVSLLKSDSSLNSAWLLIGSPRGNSTRETLRNIKEPGVVWRCSIGRKNETCGPLIMDNNDDIIIRLNPDKKEILAVEGNRNNSWLGGSMAIEDSMFISCASKWKNIKYSKSNKEFMNGVCYWRTKNDISQDTPGISPPTNNFLIPLSNSTYNEQVNEDLQLFNYHFGQVGFSSHLAKNNADEELVLGAPGIHNWKGSVLKYSINQNQNVPNEEIFSKLLISNPEKMDKKFLNDSYFGYSLTSGKFLQSDPNKFGIQYVGGAPRSGLKGKVIIFNFPQTQDESLKILQDFESDQIGSYFGYSVCAVDLNNDGFDDLIVGAPLYKTKKTFGQLTVISGNAENETKNNTNFHGGSPENIIIQPKSYYGTGDEGAVFIFMSNRGNNIDKSLNNYINGANVPFSRFGSSIISIGDINKDGFNDIAIGAPYEDGGAVYIYHGGSNGLNKLYSQRIKADEIDINLRGFGYSLASGIDIDANGYNDLAIGAYDSSQTVILRTRPSIKLEGDVRAQIKSLPSNISGFEFQSCVKYSGEGLPSKLEIEVKLIIDAGLRPPRILIHKKLQSTLIQEEIYLEEASNNIETCSKFDASRVRPFETLNTNFVEIKQIITLPESDTKAGITKYEIVEGFRDYRVIQTGNEFEKMCKNCPIVDPKKLHTTSLKLPIAMGCGEKEFCSSDLRINALFRGISGSHFVIGSNDSLILDINVKNHLEIALSPSVTISFPKRNLARIPSNCQEEKNSTSLLQSQFSNKFSFYTCQIAKRLEENQEMTLTLEFDMSDLVAGEQGEDHEALFTIEAKTASKMENGPVITTLNLLLRVEAEIFIEGRAQDQIMPFYPETEAEFLHLKHSYTVYLKGASTVGSVWIDFLIPVNLTSPKGNQQIIQFQYPKFEYDGVPMDCRGSKESDGAGRSATDLDAALVQPSTQFENERDLRRKKRNASLKKMEKLKKRNKLVVKGNIFFDCSYQFVYCREVICKLTNFNSKSNVNIDFTLKLSSKEAIALLKEHKGKAIFVKTEGKAEIIMDLRGKNDTKFSKQISTVTEVKGEFGKTETWIYMGGVLAGILILGCIICCLYAGGCIFKDKSNLDPPEDEADGENDEPGEESPLNTERKKEENDAENIG